MDELYGLERVSKKDHRPKTVSRMPALFFSPEIVQRRLSFSVLRKIVEDAWPLIMSAVSRTAKLCNPRSSSGMRDVLAHNAGALPRCRVFII